VRLFCLPYAGGGLAAFFKWADALPACIELGALQLPGRAARLREAPFEQMGPLADAIVRQLAPLLDRPFALFGHSMGALVSFEVAHRLWDLGAGTPRHLFVSASRAPHAAERGRVLHALSDAELVMELRRLNGMAPQLLDEPELLQLVLPAVRADLTVCETYACATARPLPCPITAFGGLDDPRAPREDIEAWLAQTSGPFELHMIPGDHFFLHTAQEQMLSIIGQRLA
jgi:medium-chain acyl-[acyl-carrier-protein] hydrolase